MLRDTNDGFEVARRDLELRGPGELLGTRQTGLMQLRVADLVRDADLLPGVQRAADLMLGGPQANIAALLRRWVGDGGALRQGLTRPAASTCATPPTSTTNRGREPVAAAARLREYARLMRLDRPIGIWLLLWPVLWALWIASSGGTRTSGCS